MQSSIEKLALRIYKGTQSTGLGERPLVSVGSVPITFRPAIPSLVNEPEIWILLHHQDYTLYAYRVIQEDATSIQICLLVPVGMRLSADNSPYGLLIEALDIFKRQGNKNVSFEELMAKCALEERMKEMYLPVMVGQNSASFCADSRTQVKALLMFSQYPQLAGISWLEIGLECDSTVSLPIKANRAIKPDTIHPKESQQEGGLLHSGEVKNDKTDKNRKIGRVLVYTFSLIVFVLGVIFSYREKQSDQSSNLISILDTTSVGKPLTNKGYMELVIEKDSIIVVPSRERAERKISEQAEQVSIRKAKRTVEKRDEEKIKERARMEILDLVNDKDLDACRLHYGWKEYLTHEERLNIESVLLAFPEYKKLSPTAREKIRMFNKRKFHSFEEIKKAKYRIIEIINEDKFNK